MPSQRFKCFMSRMSCESQTSPVRQHPPHLDGHELESVPPCASRRCRLSFHNGNAKKNNRTLTQPLDLKTEPTIRPADQGPVMKASTFLRCTHVRPAVDFLVCYTRPAMLQVCSSQPPKSRFTSAARFDLVKESGQVYFKIRTL